MNCQLTNNYSCPNPNQLLTTIIEDIEGYLDDYAAEHDCDYLDDCDYLENPNPNKPIIPRPGPLQQACCQNQKQSEIVHSFNSRNGNIRNIAEWDRISLRHTTINPGNGPYPKRGDKVTINYVIKDVQGKGLDWSRKPFRFKIGDPNIMPGLNQGICKFRQGETGKLYLPSEMAYGWEGVTNRIDPHTDLVMKITLEKVKIKN